MPTAPPLRVSFNVLGLPAPGGSKRAIKTRSGKVVLIDACKRNKSWRTLVAVAAREALNGAGVLQPPLALCIEFRMPRPRSHYGSDGTVKASAPWVPTVRPDATKLLRSTEDALTGILWSDDAQIVEQRVSKAYAVNGAIGAWVTVCTVNSKNANDQSKSTRQAFCAETPSFNENDELNCVELASRKSARKHRSHRGRSRAAQ